TEPTFYVSDDVLAHFREALERGAQFESEWDQRLQNYSEVNPENGVEFKRVISGELPANWKDALPVFPTSEKGMATRSVSGKVINALAGVLPELVGGSADLSGSNSTVIEKTVGFQKDSYQGRMINYGVREHGMGAINNGLNQHGGLI